MKKNGFTLIEILVAMAIVAIIGVIFVTIFANTLRGSNKSQVLASLKQNGQAILEKLGKNIRDADNVVCITPNPAGQTIVIVKDGCYVRYRFIEPSSSPIPVQNGQIQQDFPQPDPSTTPCLHNSPAPSATPAGIVAFTNQVCAAADPMDDPNILTDTNPQSGVSVTDGLFTWNKQSGSKDSVNVFFNLKPGVSAPAAVTGQIDPIPFQTTIGLR